MNPTELVLDIFSSDAFSARYGLLRRRSIMETVFDQLKHLLQIEHTRHRSPTNFAVNVLAGLVAYCHQPNKLSIYRNGRPQLTDPIPN